MFYLSLHFFEVAIYEWTDVQETPSFYWLYLE